MSKLATVPKAEPGITDALDLLHTGDPMTAEIQAAYESIKQPASNSMLLSEFTNNSFRLNVDAAIDDLRLLNRNSRYWSALAGKGAQLFDTIFAIAADANSFATFVVVEADSKRMDAQLTSFHKIHRRAHPTSGTSWLRPGDTLEHRHATATLPAGWVVVRADGIELMAGGGVPYKDEESCRRGYTDAAYNRDPLITKYQP